MKSAFTQHLKNAPFAQNGLVLGQRFWENKVEPCVASIPFFMKLPALSFLVSTLTLATIPVTWSQTPTPSITGFDFAGNAAVWASSVGNITVQADSSSGSPVLSNIASTVGIRPGMVVVGTGVPASALVVDVTSNSVTLSSGLSSGGAGRTYGFTSPWRVNTTGNATSGSDVITNLPATSNLKVGMSVYGPGYTGAATIVEIVNSTTVRVSSSAGLTASSQAYTFAHDAATAAGQAGQTALLNLDLAAGRNTGSVTKDIGTVAGALSYSATLQTEVASGLTDEPVNADAFTNLSSITVNVVEPDGTVRMSWSQQRGASIAGFSGSYDPATRQVTVTFANAALRDSVSGKVIRAVYTRNVTYVNRQVADAVMRVGVTNGSVALPTLPTLTFSATLPSAPTHASLSVTDGVHLWTQLRGSTNPKAFMVTYNESTRLVTVNYESKETSGNGRLILASYATASGPAVRLGSLLIGDSAGGKQIGLRLNSLTLDSQSGMAQLIKTSGVDDEIASRLTLADSTLLAVRTGGSVLDSFRLSGPIDGGGSLIKVDSGNVSLLGANTYAGSTFIQTTGGTTFLRNTAGGNTNAIPSSTVFLGNSNRDGTASSVLQLEASQQINDAATLHFDGVSGRFAFLKLMGNDETIGRLVNHTGAGVVENVESEFGISDGGILTLNSSQDAFYNGFLRAKASDSPASTTSTSTGTLSIVKNGTGTQTFAGSQIWYNGATTINAGALQLSNINNPLGGALPEGTNAGTVPRFQSSVTTEGFAKLILAATTDWAIGNVQTPATTFKTSVRVATTKQGALATAFANGQTVDGVVLQTNDRILIKNQPNAAENGIYIVNASGAPTRAVDANDSSELVGAAVAVTAGTANAGKRYTSTNQSVVLGTTGLAFAQVQGGSSGLPSSISTISGAGTVVKNGASTIRITSPQDYTGLTQIENGTLRLVGGLPSFLNQDANNHFTRVDGRVEGVKVGSGGALTSTSQIQLNGGNLSIENIVSDNNAQTISTDRVNDDAAIISKGGIIQFLHNAGGSSYSETLGALTLDDGLTDILASRADHGSSLTSILTLNGISRTKGGVLDVRGAGIGGIRESDSTAWSTYGRNQLLLSASATVPTLVGGATSSTGILGGWATTTNSRVRADGSAIADVDFLTYDAGSRQIRAFSNYNNIEDVPVGNWTSSTNLRVGGSVNPNLSGNVDRTINSLNMDSSSARAFAIAGSRTLTVASGGIISRGNNHAINAGKITAGVTDSLTGARELFVNVGDLVARNLTMTTQIVDFFQSAGVFRDVTLVKSGVGRLTLNADNTATSSTSRGYSGGTVVNQGGVEITAVTALGRNPVNIKSDFLTLNGGYLRVPAPASGIRNVTLSPNMGVVVGERGGSFALNQGVRVNLSGPLSGTGDLLMGGTGGADGTLLLSGTNTFTGRLRVDFGVVEIVEGSNQFSQLSLEGGQIVVWNAAALNDGVPVTMSGGALDMTRSKTIGALSGTGTVSTGDTNLANPGDTIRNHLDPVVLKIDQEGDSTFAGSIVATGARLLGIEKTGHGVLRLTGESSFYDGATIITKGVLAASSITFRSFAENPLLLPSSIGSGSGGLRNDQGSAGLLKIADGAGLSYVGNFLSQTSRPFTIGTGNLGAAIYANGTRGSASLRLARGALYTPGSLLQDALPVVVGYDGLAFDSPNQDATLILGGLNGGNNTFEHNLNDNGTGITSLTKTGSGRWIVGERLRFGSPLNVAYAPNFSGRTTILDGTLAVITDRALGAAGGPEIHVIRGNLDIETNYSVDEDIALMGGRLRVVDAPGGNASWAGDIRLDVNSSIETRANQTLRINGTVGGAGSLRKEGFGTLWLGGSSILRGNTTVAEGTLRLDYTTVGSSKLADGASLVLGGGRSGGVLDIVGGTSSIREDVANLVLAIGANRITRSDPTSNTIVRLNNVTITQGAILDLGLSGLAQTDRNNLNGMLGAWLTVGGSDWAINSTNGNDGSINAVSNYVTNTWAPRNQTTITANGTVNGLTTNSLRYNSNVSTKLDLVGDNNIFSNGILQTTSTGTNVNVIDGGRLVLSHDRDGGNLTVHQNNPAGTLRIQSEITNGYDFQGVTVNFNSGENDLNVVSGTTSGLSTGMTISAPGIPPGTTITSVSATQIQISAATNAAGTNVAPHLDGFSGLTLNLQLNSAVANVNSDPALLDSLYFGMPITGAGIRPGTTVLQVNKNPSGTSTVTMSQTASQSVLSAVVAGGLNNLVVNMVSGSGTLTVVSGSVLGLYQGMPVSGPNITPGSVITGFPNNTQFNIAHVPPAGSPTLPAVTASANNVAITVGGRNGLVKAGAGTLVLTGNNTFTGPVVLSGGALSVSQINNFGTSGPLGMQSLPVSNPFNNLTIANATLQYTGNNAETSRGFKVNEEATIEVGLKGSNLIISGDLSGGDGAAAGTLVKSGSGELTISRKAVWDGSKYIVTGGATNIGGLEVNNGTLRLQFDNANSNTAVGVDNRFASTSATVRLEGGKLELVGTDNDDTPPPGVTNFSENRTQSLLGQLTIGAGASEIRVRSGANSTTTLDLQDAGNVSAVIREAGATLLLVEDPRGTSGIAQLRLAVSPVDQSIPLTWATYLDTSSRVQRGVNNFAAIEVADDGVISADSKGLYRITPEAAFWVGETAKVVSEGAQAFSGIVPERTTVGALRYFNQGDSLVSLSPNTTTSSQSDLTLAQGAILVGANVGAATKIITGGKLTSEFEVGPADQAYYGVTAETFNQNDLIVHNYAPAATFRIESIIEDNALTTGNSGRAFPVNFIHTGDGTTRLAAANTYTGFTFANSGTILLESSGALPGGIGATGGLSNLRFDGGVLGLGVDGVFSRGLGNGQAAVQWVGSGGFAAFGGSRDVNIGGTGAQVSWGSGGFVPEAATLLLSASNATGTVRFVNPINLGGGRREIGVADGSAAEDAVLLNGVSGLGGSLHKLGQGTLRIAGVGSHTRGTFLGQGTLIVGEAGLGTGNLEVGSTSNSASGDRLRLILQGGTVQGNVVVGNQNANGMTVIQVAQRTTFANGLTMDRGNLARGVVLEPAATRALTVNGATTGGSMLINGGGTVGLYGTWTGAQGLGSDPLVNGSVVIRHGTVVAGANDAFGAGPALELGDSIGNFAAVTVDRSTGGSSLTNAGGVFEATSRGFQGSGGGTGAFIFSGASSILIDGYTYTPADAGKLILVEGESENPASNGVYELKSFPGNVISLVRAENFDSNLELSYGRRIAIAGGTDAGQTFFLFNRKTIGASPSVDPVYFHKETSLNPDVAALIDGAGISVSNDIDINSTIGTGRVTLGGALSLGSGTSSFTGDIRLQDTLAGVNEVRTVRMVSETLDASGIIFSGNISEQSSGDRLGFIKEGLGNITLSGTNTFRGGIEVESGGLLVSNSGLGSGTGTGAVVVNNIGSLLGGTGRVGGNTTMNVGTVLSPGDPLSALAGIQTLSFDNALSLGGESTLLIDIGASGHDKVDVDGLFTVSASAIIRVALDFIPSVSATYDILDWGTLVASGGLSGALDLPELAVSTLYWDTSAFDSSGQLQLAVSSGVGPPPVRFAVKEASGVEGDTIRIAMQSNWVHDEPITITLVGTSGSAQPGANADFILPALNQVVIPAGQTSATLSLLLRDDPLTEGAETAIIRLGTVTNGLKGSPATLTIRIADNDSGTGVGEAWVLRNPKPTSEALLDVAHSGTAASGQISHVAVGRFGTILTSVDGISWVKQKLAVTPDLHSVVWTGSQWMAVGSNGSRLTSPDGIAWTIGTFGTPATITEVSLLNGNLFAVGESGSLYISSNSGVTWSLRNSGVTTTVRGITWNTASGYVAVGDAGAVITSPDGLVWSAAVSNTSEDLLDVVASSGLFVATGKNGISVTSVDASTWLPGSLGAVVDFTGIHWNGSTFTAVGVGGNIRTSSNGTTWTSVASSVTTDLASVTHGAGKWFTVGRAGMILSSTNATAWTRHSTGSVSRLAGVTRAGSRFVAVGDGGTVLTSPNGIDNWTPATSGTSQTLRSTAASLTHTVAVGDLGTILTSANSTNTWSTSTSPVGDSLRDITFVTPNFVAVGANGAIVTSPSNGSTWTQRVTGVLQTLNGVAGSGSVFVAVGATGVILTSSDGVTWVPASSVPVTATFNDVVWAGSQFVAVGVGGVIVSSSDGSIWVRRASPVTETLNGVAWTGQKYVAVGTNGIALESSNGSTWTRRTTGTSNRLNAIAWGGSSAERVVAVGEDGTILSSEFTPPPSPTVFFATASQAVREGASPGKFNITVNLNPTADVDVRVPVTLDPTFTAAPGSDFTAKFAPITFKKGESEKNIVVTLRNEAEPPPFDSDESFTVVLGIPVPLKPTTRAPGLGEVNTHVFTILNDDAPLSIITSPVQQVLTVGSPLSLAVTARGGDKATVQWRKNGANLKGGVVTPTLNIGESTATFDIPSVNLTHGGRYDARVSNPVPARSITSSAAEVLVIDKTDRPVPTAVGGTVTLKALASGSALTFRWYKGASPLGEVFPYKGTTTATLTIKPFSTAEAGDYYCKVTCAAANPVFDVDTGLFLVREAVVPALSVPTSVHVTGGTVSGGIVSSVIGKAMVVNPNIDPDPAKFATAYKSTPLPAGLKLNPVTGAISGIPTAATLNPGLQVTVTGFNPAVTPTTTAGNAVTYTFNIQPVPGSAVGTFVALLNREPLVNVGHGGRLDVKTTPLGAFSGSLLIGTKKYPFKGQMDTLPANPTGSVTLPQKTPLPGGATAITITFAMDVASNGISGTVVAGAGTADFSGWRNVWFKNKTASNLPTAHDGQHNVVLEITTGDEGSPTRPQGNGYFYTKVNKDTGAAPVIGRAAEGSVIATAGFVGPAGQVMVFSPLYNGTGSLMGVAVLDVGEGRTVTGLNPFVTVGHVNRQRFSWSRDPQVSLKDRVYRSGWSPAMQLDVFGGLYLAPVAKPLPAPAPGTPPQIALGVQDGGQRLFIGRRDSKRIASAGLSGTSSDYNAIVLPSNAEGVVYDSRGGRIFWTSPTSIGSALVDGSQVSDNFISTSVTAVNGGIALDTVNGYIYWAQSVSSTGGGVMRARNDGTNARSVVSGVSVSDVAVDSSGRVYYSYTNNYDIGRYTPTDDLSGTNEPNYFPEVGGGPGSGIKGIAIENDVIYWTLGNGIGKASIALTGLVSPFIVLVNAPEDILVMPTEAKIFWTAGNTVGRANLDGSARSETFLTGLLSSRGITSTPPLDPWNARVQFSAGGVASSAINPNTSVALGAPAKVIVPPLVPLSGSSLNPAGTKLTITAATGVIAGTFNLTDLNKLPNAKPGSLHLRAVKFFGLIIPDPSTNADVLERLDGVGYGSFLLNQLPDTSVTPPTTLLNSPILSGQFVLEGLLD